MIANSHITSAPSKLTCGNKFIYRRLIKNKIGELIDFQVKIQRQMVSWCLEFE